MKFSLIPKSRAKNSYELLNDVVKVMREEPKRVRFGDWLMTFAGNKFSKDVPACGTIGCIAGWCIAVRAPSANILEEIELQQNSHESPRQIAHRLFPLDLKSEVDDLFGVTIWSTYSNVEGTPGTHEHARSVIRRIRQFQKSHTRALKEFSLKPKLQTAGIP